MDAVRSLRLVELRVPTHEPEGGMALLGCQYDLEGDTLYSVKWYKDGRRSSNTVVALVNLTQESAGHYRCEVSGEAPSFATVFRQKYINIHSHLKWLVNDKPAPSSYILGPWYRVSAERPDAAETILQLSFFATTSDFVNGAIKLKCQATIAPLYQRETESTHYISLPFSMAAHPPEAKEIRDIASSLENTLATLIVPIMILILM
ncbi:hypothetical protein HW555_010484 [Spodoptera exigua]|uniref:Ig-like domain-containing protein n=1 Tax=Spodoptera exigua TaxID=7107 RepID=A0A835G8S5_SPOEX|nr:hypothetical protein HW555_010484 [Spodoptera exigua]